MADPAPEPRYPQSPLEDVKPTRAYVLSGLVENVEIALGRRLTTSTVIVRRRGKEPLTFQVEITDRNGTVANRALELLGKELGLFEGKGEEVGQDRPHIAARLKEFTAERLIAALRENPEKPEEPEA